MTTPQTLRIRGLDDLPTLVPHLLGFHPEHSLVLIGLRGERSRIVVTVRVDLPSPDDTPEESLGRVAPALLGLVHAEADEVILVVHPRPADDPWPGGRRRRPLPYEELLGEVAAELVEAGIRVRDLVCVGHERQGSYLCTDAACCPPEGRPVSDDRATVVDATMVAAGSAPLVGRESLAEQLEPRAEDDPVRIAVRRASERVYGRLVPGVLERVDRFVGDLRRGAGSPRDAAARTRLVATVEHLVDRISSRDLLMRGLTVEADHALLKQARQVLCEAVRCADPPRVAPLAAVLAVCCWVDGDGAAAWAALDRALAADAGYSLALLVATALQQGQPPWIWTTVMAELNVEEVLAADRPDPGRWPA